MANEPCPAQIQFYSYTITCMGEKGHDEPKPVPGGIAYSIEKHWCQFFATDGSYTDMFIYWRATR